MSPVLPAVATSREHQTAHWPLAAADPEQGPPGVSAAPVAPERCSGQGGARDFSRDEDGRKWFEGTATKVLAAFLSGVRRGPRRACGGVGARSALPEVCQKPGVSGFISSSSCYTGNNKTNYTAFIPNPWVLYFFLIYIY